MIISFSCKYRSEGRFPVEQDRKYRRGFNTSFGVCTGREKVAFGAGEMCIERRFNCDYGSSKMTFLRERCSKTCESDPTC